MVNWLKSNLVPGRSRVGREPRTEKAGYLHIWWNLSALAWERRLRAHLCSCPCILHHSHFRKTHSWRDGDIYIFIVSEKCTKLTLKAYLFIYAPSSSETLQQKNIPLGINKVYLPNVSKYIRGGFNKKNLPHHTKTPFVQLCKLRSPFPLAERGASSGDETTVVLVFLSIVLQERVLVPVQVVHQVAIATVLSHQVQRACDQGTRSKTITILIQYALYTCMYYVCLIKSTITFKNIELLYSTFFTVWLTLCFEHI